MEKFQLEAERFDTPEGLETLHRYLTFSYQPQVGPTERLIVSLELYALLIDLANGVQILDAFSDDVFANLSVFTQRLAIGAVEANSVARSVLVAGRRRS